MSEALEVIAEDDCWIRIGVRGDRSCPELKTVIHCRNCPVFVAASQRFFDRARTGEYERELTSLVAGTADTSKQDAVSVLTFVIGDEAFALETRSFVEVTEEREEHRIPHRTSHVFSGIVNIHGQLELCVSLAGLLETDRVAAEPSQQARMVVVEDERGQRWVFRADAVLGVELVKQDALSDAPATLTRKSQKLVSRVFELQGRAVALLDGKALFAALDRSVR
jgi:chemotaxis-related protein WspD